MSKYLKSFTSKLALTLAVSCLAIPVQADVSFQVQPEEARQTNLPIYLWKDNKQQPRAVVLLIHGISQRAGTLHCLATDLASNGCLTYGFDLRGHGWWHYALQPGSEGYRVDYKKSVKDVDEILTLLKKEQPDLPIFIVGESVGSSVALRAAADNGNLVNGLVLAGAGFKSGHVKPSWIAGDLVQHVIHPTREINIVRYQKAYGTDDIPALEETIADPDQRKTFTLGELIKVVRFVGGNRKYARRLSPETSVYVVEGQLDQTLTPKSAKQVFAAVPSQDKQFLLVPKCGHILLGTNHMKPVVMSSITEFIKDRSPESAVASGPGTIPE